MKGINTFSLRLSIWEWEPIIRTPTGINSSLLFKVKYESVLPAIDFSISFIKTIKGPFLLSSNTTWEIRNNQMETTYKHLVVRYINANNNNCGKSHDQGIMDPIIKEFYNIIIKGIYPLFWITRSVSNQPVL